jgi:hypothetical protein
MWKTCGKYHNVSENFLPPAFSTAVHKTLFKSSAEKWKSFYQIAANKCFTISGCLFSLCKIFCWIKNKTMFN